MNGGNDSWYQITILTLNSDEDGTWQRANHAGAAYGLAQQWSSYPPVSVISKTYSLEKQKYCHQNSFNLNFCFQNQNKISTFGNKIY